MSLPIILASKNSKNRNISHRTQSSFRVVPNKFFLNFCKKIFCYSNKLKNFPKNKDIQDHNNQTIGKKTDI